jgi:hypothetical protein
MNVLVREHAIGIAAVANGLDLTAAHVTVAAVRAAMIEDTARLTATTCEPTDSRPLGCVILLAGLMPGAVAVCGLAHREIALDE